MEPPTARETSDISGGSSEAERHPYKRDSPAADRETPSLKRSLLIPENGRDRHVPESAGHGGDAASVERHRPDRDRPPVERHRPDRDRPPVERHGANRGRRDDVLTSFREESVRGVNERDWHALLGYDRGTSPMFEGAPHPISGYERLSVERAHTMKDFEKQITELKKENFNLKLRIYFLEEQVQRRCDTSNDELHRMNIELKVEVESLKHDFQEKHNLLVRASKAMESLAGEHDLAVQRLRDEHLKHLQDMEDAFSHKVRLLEAEVDQEKAELEKMCVLLDQERMQRFTAEERLMAVNDQYTKSMGGLKERDWVIQCLNETVHSKDALIAQLEKQIASMMPYEASGEKTEKNTSNLYLERDAKDLTEPPKPICNVDGKEENVNEWQKKIKEMDNLINELQQKLEANKAGFAAEEKNSLKRDKAIQGLTMALKKKTKENDKLLNEIDTLNAALSKAREAAQQARNLKENIHPDYQKLIFTLQAEQDVHSRLLKYERESGSLQKELESIAMLRRWLEENIQANQELRKIMEAQIMAKYKGEDSMSFLGDQTSYLSICLDHLDQNEYFFAGGPQGTAVTKMNVGESGSMFNHLREEAGTQTQSEVSVLAGGSLKQELDYKANERDTVKGEDGGHDAKSTRNQDNTVSSATQTEPRAFSDKCIGISRISKESAELMWSLQDKELNIPSQRLPEKTSNTTFEIQGYQEGEKYAKRSRIPVPLKSSLNNKLKSEAAVTLAKENDRNCLEKELQIESSRLYEQIKRAEKDVKSYKEDKDVHNNPSQNQRDPTARSVHGELQLENHRLSESETENQVLRCKESELRNSEQRESTERAFRELQAENHRLSEQLKQALKEMDTLKANEDLVKHKDVVSGTFLPGSIEEQRESTDKELKAENDRLSQQLKQAQTEIETLKANEEIKHKDTVLDLARSDKVQMESGDRALQKELQAESHRLSEQLKQAQMEIQTLKANEELLRCKVSDHQSKDEQRKSTERGLEEELQAENYRLSEQLKRAQMEIKTLKASEELLRCKATEQDSKDEQRKSTERALEEGLQAENYRLSEQLKQAQMEIKTLKANEELIKHKDAISGLSYSFVATTDLSLQNELQAENNRLSEQLKQAQMEIRTLKANEELLRCKVTERDSQNSKDEQRKSTERGLEEELQAENYRLSEQLKRAQMEIKTLKANEELTRHKDAVPDLSYSFTDQIKSSDQSLHRELQAEKSRLSEQSKTAHMTLQAEQRSTDSSDDSLRLHGSDADDDLSEQSFLDKTITNSVNVNGVGATLDFGNEVCRPHVISQNAVALRCHHDSHCTECANNRGILLPTSSSKRASTMRSSSKFTKVSCSGRSFEDTTSLSKYDLLVQSQARELSLQRQKIKESHNLSVICSKNFYNILKAFENLFPAGALDSNITLGFQEQITQTVEWLKELEYKLSDAFYGEEDAYSDQSVDSLLYTPSRLVPGHRMWADKHGCHVLGLVEDYNALRKQILEARNVLQEMEALIDHGVQTAVLNMTEHFGDIFFEKLTRTKQSLDEAGCLLKLFWRVSLPLHSPYSINQEEEVNLEVTRLRKRVIEQEKLLSGMVKRVYSENQMKEDIEKLILDQLAMTHDILKRAKGNLEVQVVDKVH